MKILKNIFGKNTKIATSNIADETGVLVSEQIGVELWSGAASAVDTVITLKEPITNFKRIGVYSELSTNYTYAEDITSRIVTNGLSFSNMNMLDSSSGLDIFFNECNLTVSGGNFKIGRNKTIQIVNGGTISLNAGLTTIRRIVGYK